MPWTNDNLDLLFSKARKILLNEFPDIFTARIYICTQLEMIEKIKKEIKREEFKGEIKKYLARFIIGKYYAEENIIWLVEGKGLKICHRDGECYKIVRGISWLQHLFCIEIQRH